VDGGEVGATGGVFWAQHGRFGIEQGDVEAGLIE
jgi:hypothetical protein